MTKIPRKTTSKRLADVATVLEAANAAPAVFNIAVYFTPLYVMRKKGYSWRYLSEWLAGFNIEISHVHLHRLYTSEDARLDELGSQELQKLGMAREMIEERLAKDDPHKRLVAPDPGDEETEDVR